MNKKYLILFSILLMATSGWSKEKTKKQKIKEPTVKMSKLDYGMNLGMCLAFPAGPLVQNAQGMPFPGPVINGNIRYYFSNKISTQLGVTYYWNQTRFQTPYSNFTYIGNIDINMPDGSTIQQYDTVNIFYAVVKDGLFKNKFIGIPIHCNYHFNKVWSMSLGGYFAILLKGGMTGVATDVVLGDGSSSDFQVADDVPFDQGDQFNKFDYGLNVGANAQLPNGFNFDLKVNTGLASMFKKEFTAPPGTYRNIFIQGTLGFRIGARERFKPDHQKI